MTLRAEDFLDGADRLKGRPQIPLSAWDLRLLMDCLRRCADRDAEDLHLRLSEYFGKERPNSAILVVESPSLAVAPDAR